MKRFASFLVLVAALGCRTAPFNAAPASLISLHGGVQTCNTVAWTPAQVNQPLANGAKIHADPDAYADLSAAHSLTLRSKAPGAAVSPTAPKPPRACHRTRTVLVVEKGCVLVSVGDLAPGSDFEVQAPEVVAQIRDARFSRDPRGASATVTVTGHVSLTAGDPARVVREDASLDAQQNLLVRAQNHPPAPAPLPSFFCRAAPFSPFDYGLLCARQR